MVTDPTTIDPLDCPDCVTAGDICAYHQGWADGWDCCASVVGAHVQARDDRADGS